MCSDEFFLKHALPKPNLKGNPDTNVSVIAQFSKGTYFLNYI